MQQKQVHVAQSAGLDGFGDGLPGCVVRFKVVPEFGCVEHVGTGEAGGVEGRGGKEGRDCPAGFGFVEVPLCRVEGSIA